MPVSPGFTGAADPGTTVQARVSLTALSWPQDAPLVPGTPSQAPSGPLGATVRGSALSSTSRPTRSARSRYTTPAHSVGGARAASASRAARGGDPGALGSSQKALDPEHGAGRPGTPSREQLGLRQSATSVDYEVARLGDVSGTGKPLRPIR